MVFFFSKHQRKTAIPTWLWAGMGATLLIAFFWYVHPHIAFAQTEDPEFRKLLISAQNVFQIILGALKAVFWPILLMIGGLLDNELIFGGAMGEALRSIWVTIRNFVNVIFVLVLIVIAVYNVLGLGEKGGPLQSLQLKQSLPKFILALIVVNFSFLGAKVFLDLTNVLTTAVFALPVQQTDFVHAKDTFEKTICKEGIPLQKIYCNGPVLGPKGEAFFQSSGKNNVGLIMAVSFGKLPDQSFIRDGVEGLLDLSFNVIFAIVLYIIYAVSFIILFAVLLVRIAVLWVLVALSPLMAISIVIPQISQLGGEGGNLGQKFLKHAIAPAIVGLFLSIGYIMLNALNGDRGIAGGYFSSIQVTDIDPNVLVTGMSDLQQMLAAVSVAAIVWVGAGVAAKGTVAEKFSEGLRTQVANFGKWAAKLPTYLQAIPVGEAGSVSLEGLKHDFSMLDQATRKHGMEGGLFKEGTQAYSKFDTIDDPKELGKEIRNNSGILRDQPEKLAMALEHAQLPDVAKGVREAVKNLTGEEQTKEIAKILTKNENLRGSIGLDGKDLAEKARTAPVPAASLELKEQFRDQILGPQEAREYMRQQSDIRNAMTSSTATVADLQGLGDAFKGFNKTQFDEMKNQYKLIGDERGQKALTFFEQDAEPDPQNILERLKAAAALAQSAKNSPNTFAQESEKYKNILNQEFINAIKPQGTQ